MVYALSCNNPFHPVGSGDISRVSPSTGLSPLASPFNPAVNITAVSYVGGIFIAGGNGEEILYSSDMVNWRTGSGLFIGVNAIAYDGNGTYVAVGNAGKIGYSHNLSAWSTSVSFIPPASAPGGIIKSVVFDGSNFVCASQNDGVYSSSDGINWNALPTPTMSTVNVLIHGGGSYVVVGDRIEFSRSHGAP